MFTGHFCSAFEKSKIKMVSLIVTLNTPIVHNNIAQSLFYDICTYKMVGVFLFTYSL